MLKAENLQRTGSFKLRGALNSVAAIADATAVVCGSAGNHAQALAYAARARGLACEVFMPAEAAVAKVAAVQGYGGHRHARRRERRRLHRRGARAGGRDRRRLRAPVRRPARDRRPGDARARAARAGPRAREGDRADRRRRPRLRARRRGQVARPEVEVIGVQIAACAPFPAALSAGAPLAVDPASTIADGIAVKRPGASRCRSSSAGSTTSSSSARRTPPRRWCC